MFRNESSVVLVVVAEFFCSFTFCTISEWLLGDVLVAAGWGEWAGDEQSDEEVDESDGELECELTDAGLL